MAPALDSSIRLYGDLKNLPLLLLHEYQQTVFAATGAFANLTGWAFNAANSSSLGQMLTLMLGKSLLSFNAAD